MIYATRTPEIRERENRKILDWISFSLFFSSFECGNKEILLAKTRLITGLEIVSVNSQCIEDEERKYYKRKAIHPG